MIDPDYQDVPKKKIPEVKLENEQGTAKVVTGEAFGVIGPVVTHLLRLLSSSFFFHFSFPSSVRFLKYYLLIYYYLLLFILLIIFLFLLLIIKMNIKN